MGYRSDFVSLAAGTVGLVGGWAQPFYPQDPAPGARYIAHTVQGDAWETLFIARAQLTADGTAGTRLPRLELIDPSGAIIYAIPLSTGVVAGGVLQAHVAVHGPTVLAASGHSVISMPPVVLQPGYAWRFAHDAVGAGDLWTAVFWYAYQYPSDTAAQMLAGG